MKMTERIKRNMQPDQPTTEVYCRLPDHVIEDLEEASKSLGVEGYGAAMLVFISKGLREYLAERDAPKTKMKKALAALAADDTNTPRKQLKAYLESLPFPHYEAHPEIEGLLIRLEEDGRRIVGKFVAREFLQIDEEEIRKRCLAVEHSMALEGQAVGNVEAWIESEVQRARARNDKEDI